MNPPPKGGITIGRALARTNAVRRFASLAPADRRLVVEAATILVAVACGLRVLGFSLVRKGADRVARTPRGPAPSAQDRERAATRVPWAVAAAARRPFVRQCLVTAITADLMLRRRGVQPRLVVGTKRPRTGAPLEAHAWVELDGRTIVGELPNLAEYFVLSGPTSTATS